ncbi:MAG: glycosyltransferase [Candidatus Heimdallarchaeum aukensis]|uniref:Glycosyltransferase n=1 Tax=Candidatus Heimdallarchaeum aukensis TaxID=2876573 RepID=A0A9Y1BM65_9ARCH|nr:MAG: glycosyltransferase [Candidatus Heimdallarchaeum aukensis]
MNILLISYLFPPDKSAGGYRAASFAKYFPEKDLNVFLLTSNKEITENNELQKEYNLSMVYYAKRPKLREIGYKIKLLALLELLNLDKLLFFPDIYFPWITRAVKVGSKAIENEKIDVILATQPPLSALVVGYRLSKKFNIPLISDYRDPWNGSPFLQFPKFIKKKHLKLEKKIVKKSKMLVTIGKDCAKIIEKALHLEKDSFEIIHNGFFKEEIPTTQCEKEKQTFTVSFFGNFYLVHKPVFRTFCLGFGEFVKKHNLLPHQVKFNYAGGTSRKVIRRMVHEAEIEDYFHDLGYLSKRKFHCELQKSNVLILLYPKGIEYALPTKLYDYILGNSHIMLISYKKDNWSVLDEIEQQYTQVQISTSAIYEKLWSLYNKWKNNKLKYGCNEEKIMSFERKFLAYKYSEKIKAKFMKH